MAHAARISTLAEGLIAHLASPNKPNGGDIKHSPEQALKNLRTTNHARANPFEVQSKLDGLVEKFLIRNRDDVAEALQARLDELPAHSHWLPDILAFLLLLSNNPVNDTRLRDLDAIHQTSTTARELSWASIIADDPLNDPDIWDDVERGYHSSGDDALAGDEEDDDDNITTSTDATSVIEDDLVALATQHIVQTNDAALDDAERVRHRLPDFSNAIKTSGIVMIRETLSMLHGLPSTMYDVEAKSDRVLLIGAFGTGAAPTSSIYSLLNTCAEIGSSVNKLRTWTRTQQSMACLQSCQAATRYLLTCFAHDLAAIEKLHIFPEKETVVSLIDVRTKVEKLAKPLVRLSDVVQEASTQFNSTPFAHLNLLFEEACIAQMSGDAVTFSVLLHVLFAGLRTYLRAVSTWVQTGRLEDRDQTLFVTESNSDCDLSGMWHERFSMRTLPNGRPSSPTFLQNIANRAFAYGKSKAFLEALNGLQRVDQKRQYPLPDFDALLRQVKLNQMCPFAETLNIIIEHWVTETGQDCTPLLCRSLLYNHAALDTLRGLNTVFCSRDDRAFTTFAEALCWRMDSKLRWRDRFLLTEFAQSMLSGAPGIDADSLTIVLEGPAATALQSSSSIDQMRTIRLEIVLPWAVQVITRTKSVPAYSKLFTYLLQIYRARFFLHSQVSGLHLLSARNAPQLSRKVNVAIRLRQSLLAAVNIIHDHVTQTAGALNAALCRDLAAADGIDAMVDMWRAHEKEMDMSLLLARKLKPIQDASVNLLRLCEEFGNIWTKLLEEALSQSAATEENDERCALSATKALSIPSLPDLQSELDKLLSFLASGLRSISRVGGHTSLETLADRLHWNVH